MRIVTVSVPILFRIERRKKGGALGNLCRKRVADFPVQAEGIDESSEAPAVSFAHGEYFGGTGLERAGEDGIGIRYGENHADGASAGGIMDWLGEFGGF